MQIKTLFLLGASSATYTAARVASSLRITMGACGFVSALTTIRSATGVASLVKALGVTHDLWADLVAACAASGKMVACNRAGRDAVGLAASASRPHNQPKQLAAADAGR